MLNSITHTPPNKYKLLIEKTANNTNAWLVVARLLTFRGFNSGTRAVVIINNEEITDLNQARRLLMQTQISGVDSLDIINRRSAISPRKIIRVKRQQDMYLTLIS